MKQYLVWSAKPVRLPKLEQLIDVSKFGVTTVIIAANFVEK
jgi:hypothetical protein